MKLEIKEIDGVPVTGIPNGSRTEVMQVCTLPSFSYVVLNHRKTYPF